ncbi:hypothetical protein PIIN_04022 [Serendipita indica DSM 11827]|uniref:Uncharacterized protein n=1 Tax=Serendipita indica (strain DSM 11827) TaxID=1109443 RepID=G4TFH9_SERID|nr:hypothetical protein PIIN_04022 [Serendipita indica DSM 11827]
MLLSRGRRAPNAAAPITASFTFNGTAVAIFGTVDDGVQNNSLNFSIQVDRTGETVQPTYSPQHLDGIDVNYKIFERSSLEFTSHTVTLTLIGETTPFYIQGAVYSTATPQTMSPPSSSSLTSSPSASASPAGDDSKKLGAAIGGGVGALLLVALIIFLMIRRIKRIEKEERIRQAQPFTLRRPTNSSRAGLIDPTPSVRSAPRVSQERQEKKKKKKPETSSSNPSISEKERLVRRDGGVSSSSRSHTQSHSRSQSQQTQSYVQSQLAHTQSYHSITQHQLNPRPDVAVMQQASPPGSVISLPSEYQATTTVGNRGPGTAVASSYIGPSPLPQEDAPPVPALPAAADMDAMMMKSKNVPRTQHTHQPSHPPPPPFEEVVPLRDYPRDTKNRDIFYPPTPARSFDTRRTSELTSITNSSMIQTPKSGALGLFSTDSVNTIGTESTGRRPLPIPPVPRNPSVTAHSFPPEKVGLSPPPANNKPQERRSSIAKRPLPPADPPSG